MKFTTKSAALHAAIQAVRLAVSDSRKIGIELEGPSQIRIHACNGMGHASVVTEAYVEKGKSDIVTVSANDIAKIVKSLEESVSVTISATADFVTFSFGKSNLRLKRDTEEELFANDLDRKSQFKTMGSVNGEDFRQALRLTVEFTNNKDVRPMMHGVIISPQSDCFEFVGTDGLWMSIAQLAAPQLTLREQVVIPDTYAGAAIKVLNSEEVHVSALMQDDGSIRKLRFSQSDGRITMTVPLIHVAIPPYQKAVVPDKDLSFLVLNAQNLASAALRMSIVSPNGVNARVDGADLVMQSQSDDQCREVVESGQLDKACDQMVFGVNPERLLKVVKTAEADSISIGLENKPRSVKISQVFNSDQEAPRVKWYAVLAAIAV